MCWKFKEEPWEGLYVVCTLLLPYSNIIRRKICDNKHSQVKRATKTDKWQKNVTYHFVKFKWLRVSFGVSHFALVGPNRHASYFWTFSLYWFSLISAMDWVWPVPLFYLWVGSPHTTVPLESSQVTQKALISKLNISILLAGDYYHPLNKVSAQIKASWYASQFFPSFRFYDFDVQPP